MDFAPVVHVEHANHGQTEAGYDAQHHECVVLPIGYDAVQLLVEGSHIGDVGAEHEHGAEEEEPAVVHLEANDVGDHGELVQVALEGAVRAGSVEPPEQTGCEG